VNPEKHDALIKRAEAILARHGISADERKLGAELGKVVRITRPRGKIGAVDPEDGTTVATIRKGETTEIRISLKPWRGGKTVELRLWRLREGSADWHRTAKHFSISVGLIEPLIAALRTAQIDA
jgi:hypothetical protein